MHVQALIWLLSTLVNQLMNKLINQLNNWCLISLFSNELIFCFTWGAICCFFKHNLSVKRAGSLVHEWVIKSTRSSTHNISVQHNFFSSRSHCAYKHFSNTMGRLVSGIPNLKFNTLEINLTHTIINSTFLGTSKALRRVHRYYDTKFESFCNVKHLHLC